MLISANRQSTAGGIFTKSHGVIKVNGTHPLETMNACTTCQCNPWNSCWDIPGPKEWTDSIDGLYLLVFIMLKSNKVVFFPPIK